jgi:phosphoglycerate kinase
MLKPTKNITDVDLSKKIVVVRANLDVPLIGEEIQDDTKIKALVPTLQHLQKQNCKIIVISSLGEKLGEYNDSKSLMPIRFELGRQLQKPLKFVSIENCDNSIKFMEFGEILMLENLYFSKEEFSTNAKTREGFIKNLAKYADYYIDESFGVDEKLSSTLELPKMVKVLNGLQTAKEYESIDKIKTKAESPFVGIVGGNDLEKKLPLLKFLAKNADIIMIGGGIAYDFLNYKKVQTGESKLTKGGKVMVKEIVDIAAKSKCEIILPVDHIVAKDFSEGATPVEVETQTIGNGLIGMDVGPKTLVMFRETIESAKTIVWCGPMGVFEWENFNRGTESVGEYIALSAPKDAYKIALGSSTLLSLTKLKIKHKRFSHISIGASKFIKLLSSK